MRYHEINNQLCEAAKETETGTTESLIAFWELHKNAIKRYGIRAVLNNPQQYQIAKAWQDLTGESVFQDELVAYSPIISAFDLHALAIQAIEHRIETFCQAIINHDLVARVEDVWSWFLLETNPETPLLREYLRTEELKMSDEDIYYVHKTLMEVEPLITLTNQILRMLNASYPALQSIERINILEFLEGDEALFCELSEEPFEGYEIIDEDDEVLILKNTSTDVFPSEDDEIYASPESAGEEEGWPA